MAAALSDFGTTAMQNGLWSRQMPELWGSRKRQAFCSGFRAFRV